HFDLQTDVVHQELWRQICGGGGFSVTDVAAHIVPVSDHQWVIAEAGLAVSDGRGAMVALIREGLRRAELWWRSEEDFLEQERAEEAAAQLAARLRLVDTVAAVEAAEGRAF
ncbi:unnamed protein product, partial [Phaeothamnion confervicola]